MLGLTKSLKDGRLQEFIAQEEARSVGPIEEADFDSLAAKVIKTERLADQTSHSLPANGSPGK